TVSLASSGNIEFCLGEVTDVMRLTDLVRSTFSSEVDTTRMVMWGHSHGGCVTLRAVEHGVQLAAAASFSGPTDFAAWGAMNDNAGNDMLGMLAPSACTSAVFLANGCVGPATPAATPLNAPMAYLWRSAASQSSTLAGDLNARAPDMPVLILQAASDE